MKSAALVSILATVILYGVCHVAAAAALPDPIVPDCLGVNIHFIDPQPGEMKMIAEAGFRWIRMDFSWSDTEREKGVYEFAAYDRLMAAIEPHHIRAILILDYYNRHYDNGLSPASDEGRAAFDRWAAAAAHHFRNRGIIWEMYNEPNINIFWKPKPDAKQYAKLAIEVGKALRQAERNELFIGPAAAGIPFRFLKTCFRSGALEYWSGVSVHHYRETDPETVAADYRRLRRMIDQYAPKGKRVPILSGEWGCEWRILARLVAGDPSVSPAALQRFQAKEDCDA
jgi:polysaccharide biosynthesis protein PslG